MINKIKETLQNFRRVLTVARKPDKEEFIRSIKICALGIALIGIIGFLFYLIAVITKL